MKSTGWFSKFLNWYKRFQISKSPQMNLVWGFFLYTIFGWLFLSIPIFHKVPVSFLDNLFISTSAISTTGLVTISIYDSYNFLGQLTILILIQIGGIGYMTLTAYYLLFTTRTISHWHQKIIGTEFTMPKTIKVRDFMHSVILFTLVMEVLGMIAYFIAFVQAGVPTGFAVWSSIFHSISSFCTAGFGLYDDSFMRFQNNLAINSITSILAICGSLGFIVVTDLWYRLTGKSKHLTFTTRTIFFGFLTLLGIGTTLIYCTEPLIRNSGESMWLKSFFQTMTAMTTVGFNTIDTGGLSLPILLLITFLMYVGASPSGTAGGMKITTLTAMISILTSRLRGSKDVIFFGIKIPYDRLYVATSTFILYTVTIFFATFLLAFTEPYPLDEILFEVSSALGTVGLSTGITAGLTSFAKLVLIVLMFIGRVGVLTFGFALLSRKSKTKEEVHEDDLAI